MKTSLKSALSELIKLLNPYDLLNYLLDTGWKRTISPREPEIVICAREAKEDIYSVLFSLDPNVFADYEEALERAILEIARYEETEPEKVILAVQNPFDAVCFRIVSPETENGTIGLSDGVLLLQAVRAAIRAAACDVFRPEFQYHTQEYTRVKHWTETCKLGQTERGSFIVSVLCPLNESPQNLFDRDKDAFSESFTRQTTTHLLQSLADVKRQIESPGLEPISGENNHRRASANLLSAVAQLGGALTHENRNAVEIGARWYAAVAPPNATPTSVIFSRNDFPQIEKIAAELRFASTKDENKANYYVGKIGLLKAPLNVETRLEGTIMFHFLDENNKSKKATVVLPREEYAQATEAHNNGLPVRVYGLLKQKGKIFTIENPKFEVWKQ